MKAISSMTGHSLQWVRLSLFKRDYELRGGEECVATLSFPSLFKREARAESADGCWTLQEKGIWKPRITVRPCNDEAPVVTFVPRPFRRMSTLDLPRWRTIRLATNFWRSRYSAETDMGELLISVRIKHFHKTAADVEIGRKAESYPELPWLMFLLWYIVLRDQRTAGAASSG